MLYTKAGNLEQNTLFSNDFNKLIDGRVYLYSLLLLVILLSNAYDFLPPNELQVSSKLVHIATFATSHNYAK